jgi:hypothetical protein
MICEKYWYWLIYVFIEFIISDNTIYTYWFVFISPLDDKKLILKYINCFKEFQIINKSKLLGKNVFVKHIMLPNLFHRIMLYYMLYIRRKFKSLTIDLTQYIHIYCLWWTLFLNHCLYPISFLKMFLLVIPR